MYSFAPTEEQNMLVEAVHRYAEKEIRSAAHEADESAELPQEIVEKGWQLGILQGGIPEAYGGFGERSALTSVLALEELAWGDLSFALGVMAPATFVLPLLIAGTEEQKQRWLPDALEGEWSPIVAAALEPRHDFYWGDLRTTARRTNSEYTLSGLKAYVPFADKAEYFLVYAAEDDQPSAFVVPRDTDGLEVGEREMLAGIRALPTYSLELKDVRVAAESRLGGEGSLNIAPLVCASHVAAAALGVGLSRAAYEYALAYAKEREAFGVPIAQKQAIAFMLAEMATEIEAIRLMVWEAAWMLDNDQDAERESHLALTGSADMSMMVTDRAVQILGGHGYIREHPVERWMRNGRGVPSFATLAMV